MAGLIRSWVQEGSSDAFRKGAQRGMGRASRASEAGLDASLEKQKDGKWRIRLVDANGTEVFNKTASTSQSARSIARQWVVDNYDLEATQETQAKPSPPRKPKHRSLGPAPSNLVAVMRARADDNEEKAVQYRTQADHLEMEAKRLREAAQALEGPDGHT
jgi:hypothetical protein